MEELKHQVRAWYLSCGAVCLGFLSITFLWRTPAFPLVLCMAPCVGLGLLIWMVIWLSRSQIGYKPVIIGACLMFVSFLMGSRGDSVARELIYRWNYRSYHAFVKKVVENPRPEVGRYEYEQGYIEGLGVYRGEIEVLKDRYEVRIFTCSGPTLEMVLFSPKPLSSEDLVMGTNPTLKHQDDLAYWFFVDL